MITTRTGGAFNPGKAWGDSLHAAFGCFAHCHDFSNVKTGTYTPGVGGPVDGGSTMGLFEDDDYLDDLPLRTRGSLHFHWGYPGKHTPPYLYQTGGDPTHVRNRAGSFQQSADRNNDWVYDYLGSSL